MYDASFFINLGSLLLAGLLAYLAARRELVARIAKIEITLAEIRQALRDKGVQFGD